MRTRPAAMTEIRMRRTMATGLLAVAMTAVLCISSPAAARPSNACESHIIAAAKKYDIPVGVLYAVGLAETGHRGSLQPFALNIAGKAVFPTSLGDALSEFQRYYDQGERLIDIGCMQINFRYHGNRFSDVESMFNPAANVAYAAKYLAELKKSQGSWAMAVARYHAGPDNDAAQKRYICTVITNLVTVGFGRWTPEAKKFCDSKQVQ